MSKQTILACAMLVVSSASLQAQGITPDMLQRITTSNQLTPFDRAIRNALSVTSVKSISQSQDNLTEMDTYFSINVPTKGITDQKSSGRCWLFTGLNVLRSKVINSRQLGGLEFSEVYLFFYDQLEKSNLFLQAVIDTRDKPMDDKTVEWLFKNPLSDGGTFTGVADLIAKYGVVPAGVMPENYTANNTSTFTSYVKRKLREDGLMLRESKLKSAELMSLKEKMLGEIYHLLTLGYGVPVSQFTWAPKGSDGNYLYAPKTYTPQQFYAELIGEDLAADYVMLMNDPTRPYWKTFEIEYDRHTYDGHNWLYLNLPLDEIKQAAIASLRDSTAMYFSCDVSKELDSQRGLLSLQNYDVESVLGVKFGMDKRQRIQTFDSGSSHAMTLCAVNLDADSRPTRWKVENSWGASSGHGGYLIMTDEWFNEYMFRLVVNKKYLSERMLQASQQKPTLLPPWDPMFAAEE